MKIIARCLVAAVALGVIGFNSGCVSQTTTRSARLPEMSFSMKVVDSSTGRPLTEQEMKTLHDATIRFLARHEETLLGGTFYIRVKFAAAKPDTEGEWVLVQIISQQIDDTTRVAAYRTSPYYYPEYSGYGYASTYADPFYDNFLYPRNHGYYRPAPVNPSGGYQPHDRDNRDHGNNRDNVDRPRDRDNGDRTHDRNRGDRPPGTYTGGNDNNRTWERHPRSGDYTPRSDDSHRGRGHDSGGYAPTTARVSDNSGSNSSGSNSGGGSSYSPPPSSSYSPPPEPARSESSNSGVQRDSAQREEN